MTSSHPSLKFENIIQEICKPLFENTCIKYFAHCSLNNENQLAGLSTHSKITQRYIQNKYYEHDIILKDLHDKKYILWDFTKTDIEQKKILENFHFCNIGHSLTVVKNGENSKECFHFGANLNDESINGLYFQYLEILDKFILYYKDQINSNRDLRHIFKTRYTTSLNDNRVNSKKALIDSSIHVTTKYVSAINEYTISKREILCLYWLSNAKTMDEIAILLKISRRTVKAHIENIKRKIGCFTLFQLGQAYNHLELWRLIKLS